jgi:hypothetical protein
VETAFGGLAARVLGRVDNGTFFLPGVDVRKANEAGREANRADFEPFLANGFVDPGLAPASMGVYGQGRDGIPKFG